MREIESKIVKAIEDLCSSGKNGVSKKLSCRDSVRVEDYYVIYSLWGTDLYKRDLYSKEREFFISTNKRAGSATWVQQCFSEFDTTVSNTTKSRLRAILWYFHNKTICQRNYEIYSGFGKNAEKLPINKWIKC